MFVAPLFEEIGKPSLMQASYAEIERVHGASHEGGTSPSGSVNIPDFRAYIHVPFCASRCGYCDFNTYTPGELASGLNPSTWEQAVLKEITAAEQMLNTTGGTFPISSIFFGGGTPSLVGADMLSRIVEELRGTFGLTVDCEITTEANPESTSYDFFADLVHSGFTRVSLGMQSYSRRVLRFLDRKHDPERAIQAVHQAHKAGLEHISLDIIYGTPGETDSDVYETVSAVVQTPVDHVSAYSLIVEDNTALARRMTKDNIDPVEDDCMAHRFMVIDELLDAHDFSWYEVSNWAKKNGQCQHNVGYWTGDNWWGFGPGAHSAIGTQRWWNVKHPGTYNRTIDQSFFPIAGGENLQFTELMTESLMTRLRVRQGIPVLWLSTEQKRVLDYYEQQNLVEYDSQMVRVTRSGRLLADKIIRDLL